MTMLGTLFSILTGASWLAALTHLFAAVRRSYSPTHLSFAAFAFASGGQSLAHVWLHQTSDPLRYVEIMRWCVSAGVITCAALLWFARFYTRSEDRSAPVALTALYLGLLGINWYLPHGLSFDRAPELTQIMLPWDEPAALLSADFRLSRILTSGLHLATLGYVFFACWRQYRRGQRYAAMTLSIGASILLLTSLSNIVISAAGFSALYLPSFGFIALVLLMMYWLSSDESFRTVVAQASEPIFVADRRGCYTDANDAGCELLGFSRDELRRMHVFDIVAPQDLDKILAERPRLLSGAVVRGTWRFRRKDGSTFTGELSSRLLPDNRMLGMLRDVTEQQELLRKLEERVAVRTAEYAELNRQLEAFAYSVSHDLRAPVRAVSAFSQVLLQEHSQRLDAEGKRHLERIVAATSRMNELIEGLLQLAKVSHQALRVEPVDLRSMVDDIVRTLREQEPQRSVSSSIATYPRFKGIGACCRSPSSICSRMPGNTPGGAALPASRSGVDTTAASMCSTSRTTA